VEKLCRDSRKARGKKLPCHSSFSDQKESFILKFSDSFGSPNVSWEGGGGGGGSFTSVEPWDLTY
jgi:hypothetical protein